MPNFLPARIELKFRRPSHREVFEHMEEWANSHGLRPPDDETRAGGVAYGAGAPAQLHRACREGRAIKMDAFANYFMIASDRSVRPAGERCLPGDSNVPVISSIVRSTCRSFGAGRRIQVQQAARSRRLAVPKIGP